MSVATRAQLRFIAISLDRECSEEPCDTTRPASEELGEEQVRRAQRAESTARRAEGQWLVDIVYNRAKRAGIAPGNRC